MADKLDAPITVKRNAAIEGFFIGDRPKVPKRNINIVENRIVRDKVSHHFIFYTNILVN